MSLGNNTRIADTREQPSTFNRGKTLYVGGTGSGNYTKIQDAINDADDGDTVFVYDDSSPYHENVVIDKSIDLMGKNRDTTVIDGNQIGTVISITVHGVNISGFTIQNSTYGYDYAGINIYSNHNIIRDNIITLNNAYASGILLSNYYYHCYNNTITGNKISSNEGNGIRLYKSNNNVISGNNISNNNYGIVLSDYNYNNIIINNNISSNNRDGILRSNPHGPDNSTIIGNNINSNGDNGIRLYDSSNNYITGNTISSNNENGICTFQSSNNYITGNNIISNNKPGIYLYKLCKNNVVTGNNISSNREGIRLYSNGNNITGNNISSNNLSGIFLSNYYYHCYNNTITGNKIISNNGYGIYLYSSASTITNNNIISNNDNGLEIVSSNNNITGNTISSNNGNGIKIEHYSDNNLIYHNNFINNTNNANDENNNTWDDGKYGNYWSDYEERYPDAKKRQLRPWMWDTPYEIPGGDNRDMCPLVKQWPNSLSRTMPRNRAMTNLLLLRFLEQFPILHRLLSLIRV